MNTTTIPTARTEDIRFKAGQHLLEGTRVFSADESLSSVISFHGMGAAATRHRIRYLLDDLARSGVSSACVDFSGHGDSSGRQETANLRLRQLEAEAATDALCGQPLKALVGTSMGAFTAAMLAPRLAPGALVLFCPAAYPYGCDDLPFDAQFRARVGAFRGNLASPAFEAIAQFRGDVLVVASRNDAVVPVHVPEAYARSAASANTVHLHWLEHSGHQVHAWLQDHVDDRNAVLEAVRAVVLGSRFTRRHPGSPVAFHS